MTALTVILPHRRNPANDRSLAVALDCLFTNTVNDFRLLVDAAYDQPLYPRVTAMIEAATTECVVYWSSDIFCAPGWDDAMLQTWTPDSIVTGVLVEPGMIGVHHENLKADFGRSPEAFRRQAFEDWTQDAPVPNGIGFPAPYMISRAGFLAYGGLHDGDLPRDLHGFTEADNILFAKWRADGKRLARAHAYFYHLQRYSEADEQQRPERYE